MIETIEAMTLVLYSENADNINKEDLFKAAKILATELAGIYNKLETHNLVPEDEDFGGHA